MIKDEQFKGKTVLITGASSDIGTKIAQQLSSQGASLILHASNETSLKSLKTAFDLKTHEFWTCDFSKPGELKASWNSSGCTGILNGIVHCVGMRSRRPLKMLKTDHVQKVMNINFNSYIELLRVFTHRSRFENGLSVVSVSSIASLAGGASVTAYAASKAAMDAANRCLAKELHKKGIRLNSIICGQVKTSAYDELLDSKQENTDPLLNRQYMGVASPTDISEIALFLLSERSKFINGTSIHADGGYLS
jgi:NAD(P)-dependent dehydrogenase (short-subunit alcohol dehydrogenase family)